MVQQQTPTLSIVMPLRNETQGIGQAMRALIPLRLRGVPDLRAINSPAGRALQMNAGARAATGDVLLFLHADTRLPPDADALVAQALMEDIEISRRRLAHHGAHVVLAPRMLVRRQPASV